MTELVRADEFNSVAARTADVERVTADDFAEVPTTADAEWWASRDGRPQDEAAAPNRASSRAVDGATFVESVPDEVPCIWGDGAGVLWAEGEPMMLVGPDGVGKTSIAQQLMLARIGARTGAVLGQPVKVTSGRLLYLAGDRPRQAASSLRRMVTPDDYALLRERLIVWKGPLPFDLADSPRLLAEFCAHHGASDLMIDSLKDVAVDLTKDETGSRVNVALQETIASGVETVVLHHQRKQGQATGKPKALSDVYGSRWLTAGMGSVVLVWGEAGDLVVELRHLKQPAEEVGPLSVLHDHGRGRSMLHEQADLEQILANAEYGLVVTEAARLMFGTADPSRNEIEKARRRLEGFATRGRAERRDDPDGLARYFTPKRGA